MSDEEEGLRWVFIGSEAVALNWQLLIYDNKRWKAHYILRAPKKSFKIEFRTH